LLSSVKMCFIFPNIKIISTMIFEFSKRNWVKKKVINPTIPACSTNTRLKCINFFKSAQHAKYINFYKSAHYFKSLYICILVYICKLLSILLAIHARWIIFISLQSHIQPFAKPPHFSFSHFCSGVIHTM